MTRPVVGILATVCTVFLVIGIFTPGWLLTKYATFSIEWGIWVFRYCSSGVCTAMSSAAVNSQASATFVSVIEFQVESILALVCGIVGSVMGFVYWRKKLADQSDPVNGPGILGVFALASAGVIIWIPTGKMISTHITLSSLYSLLSSSGMSVGVPYSVIICALTGVGYWIVAIIFLVTVCNGRRQVPQHGFVHQGNPLVAVQQSGMQQQPGGVPYPAPNNPKQV